MKGQRGCSFEIARSVYASAGFLFYVSRILGLAQLSICSYRSRFKLKWSAKWAVYSFAFGFVLVTASAYDLVSSTKEEGQNLHTSQYVIFTEGFALQLTVCLGIFGFPFRLSRLFDFLTHIKQIDSSMPVTDVAAGKKLSISIVAGVLVAQIAFLTMDVFISSSLSLLHVLLTRYLSYCVVLAIVLQYAHMVCAVGRRVRRLNLRLSINYVLNRAQPFSVPEYFRKNKVNNYEQELDLNNYLEGMTEVYLKICQAVNALNDCHGYLVLIITFTCLIQLIFHLYFALSGIVKRISCVKIIMECLWVVAHFGRLIMIVEPCNRCLIEIKTLKMLVGKLECSEIRDQSEEQLALLSAQLHHYPIEFTAFGLGRISRSLITDFAGAVATYLVIIIQFDNT